MAKQASTSVNSTPSHDEIAAQAYQIYLREGCAEGRDMDHWLRAEAELRDRVTNGESNGQHYGNGISPQQPQEQQNTAPRAGKQQEQSSILPNSETPPPAVPISGVTRGTTPRRNPGKREAATSGR